MPLETQKRIKELLLLHLMFTTQRGLVWCFNTRGPQEWQRYLWTRRN